MKKINIKMIFLIAIIFCILTCLFLTNFKKDFVLYYDNRYAVEFPKLNKDFFTNFNNWINDNIGLRKDFITVGNSIKKKVLRMSFSNDVEEGKNDWLFYKKDGNLELADGSYIISNMDNFVNYHKKNAEELMKDNILYLVLLIPSKSTVYPEYIASKECGLQNSAIDFVENELSDEDVNVLNLKQILINGKKENKVFRQTDTHWTPYGAYISYCELLEYLNRKIGISEKSARVDFFPSFINTGDLLKMTGKTNFTENILELEIVDKKSTIIEHVDNNIYRCYENNFIDNSLKCIVYGDSFLSPTFNFCDLLAENFQHVIFHKDYKIDMENLKLEKPDIVIMQYSERDLSSISEYLKL